MTIKIIERELKPSVDFTIENYDSLIYEIEKDELSKEKKISSRNVVRLDYFD